MLNHLTLQIYNKEVARNFENHQAQKCDRLLIWGIGGGFAYVVISVVDAWRTRSGPWIAAVNIGCIFLLMVGFRIFRHYFRDIVVYHDYLVLSMFTVSVITCTLSNLNWLPEVFEGAGIEEYRSSFDG